MAEKLNPVNLIWGVVFTLIGGAFLANEAGWWDIREFDLAIIGPVLLVAAGLVLVIASFGRSRANR